jgi:hypothetical protein
MNWKQSENVLVLSHVYDHLSFSSLGQIKYILYFSCNIIANDENFPDIFKKPLADAFVTPQVFNYRH